MVRPFSGKFTIKITTSWGDPFHQLIDHTLHLQHLQVVPAPRPETWFLDSRGPSVRTSHHLDLPTKIHDVCLRLDCQVGLDLYLNESSPLCKLFHVFFLETWCILTVFTMKRPRPNFSAIDLFATGPERVEVIAKDLGKLGAKKQEATDLPDIS